MALENRCRVAVVGVGNMGKNHLRVYSEIPLAQLVAVSDINSELVQLYALQYGVKAYTDFRKMLASESIEAVSVCVPTFAHYEVAKEELLYFLGCLQTNIEVDSSFALESLKIALGH